MRSVRNLYEMKPRPTDEPVGLLRVWAEENDLFFEEGAFLDEDDPSSRVDAAVWESASDRLDASAPSAWTVDGEMWIYTHDGSFQGQKIEPEEIFSWSHSSNGHLVKS